jgi:hypothetical protein
MGRTLRSPKAFDVLQQQTFVQLQTLPNVGPATAADLLRIGIASIDDLGRRDPKDLYDRISALDGVRHDPCVLDTYASAIHAARTGEAVPWWEFSDARKRAISSPDRPRMRTF